MNSLHNFIKNLGRKGNLSDSHIYAQQSLNRVYVSLVIAAIIVLVTNVWIGVEKMRIITSSSFFILACIGFAINLVGKPMPARVFLIIFGFISIAIHSYIYGSMEMEYLAMLFPISILLLSDTELTYRLSLIFSFFFFVGIKLLHIYHPPLIVTSDTLILQIVIGATILIMSFFIIKKFKDEMVIAQKKTEESYINLQLSTAALKESESRYKAIFDNAFDGILVINLEELSPISYNRKMLDFLQIEESQNAKEDVFKFVCEQDAFDLKSSLDILKSEKKIRRKSKAKIPKGKYLHADITCVLLPPPNEQLAVVIFRDISAEIAANEKMIAINAELKNFAHAASHDLKEPLRTIRGFGELMQKMNKGKLSSQNEEFLGYIVDASTRMTTLVNDLLEYSTTANSAQKETVVDLNDVLQICMKNIRLQSIENKVVIYSNDLPKVTGSTVHLVQIFQNIISNAIKFKRSGIAPEIRINVLTNEKFHMISIRDNGIGIQAEYHEKIFGVFKRLHSKSEYEGSGIGLATCKKIIDRKGGKIWVESEPDCGTSFHFTWPVAQNKEVSISTKSMTQIANH